jgi:hypothetical protein
LGETMDCSDLQSKWHFCSQIGRLHCKIGGIPSLPESHLGFL